LVGVAAAAIGVARDAGGPTAARALGIVAAVLGVVVTLLAVLLILAAIFYSFNILSVGVFGLAALTLPLAIFGSGLGLFVAGLIYRFGQRIQVFAWSTIVLLQPVSAVFYPREVLPGVFHAASLLIPTSYVFEGMRQALAEGIVPWAALQVALALSIVYFAAGYLVFHV
ncbi:MAG: ABC transporter permease, partial [Candidatus Nanohaloarchaea archaeon]